MPAIDAYKYDGKLIPVDKAKVAKAYQCPWTQNLFATKKAYLKHLKTHRNAVIHRNIRTKLHQRLTEDLWSQNSFDNVIRWLELHPDWILDNAIRHGWHDDEKRYGKLRGEFWFKVDKLELTWNPKTSNSHSAPHTGETNWGGTKEGVPRSYPGWSGSIEFRFSHEVSGFGSDILRGSRIHLGSGGGGALTRRYEVKFFDDDWPKLSKMVTWNAIKGDNKASYKYKRK